MLTATFALSFDWLPKTTLIFIPIYENKNLLCFIHLCLYTNNGPGKRCTNESSGKNGNR